tara:strand:+ start:658 stop:2061 length:1404 start_codon:yes stop_codon:yes gene_type:complete
VSNNTKKPWGGRFKGKTNEFVESFTSSIAFDYRLWPYDLRVTIAHSKMLKEIGVLNEDELKEILGAIEKLDGMFEKNEISFSDTLEDIHMTIENELVKLIGDTAKKIHTGKSRNDQVATDLRLYTEDTSFIIREVIADIQKEILTLAKKYSQSIMPGFTHLQIAQPVTFGHVMMSWFFMLERDKQRFLDCAISSVEFCPLGSAALAGTSFSLDRKMVSDELDFNEGPSYNSLDSVSDRDFVIEFISSASILMMHLSRFSEEIILWCSSMYNFVTLSDSVCTGSSIMPQKKNPDVCELIRGKVGKVYGDLSNILVIMKAQPLSYNRDNQEDKRALFSAEDTSVDCLEAMGEVLKNLELNEDVVLKEASSNFSTATDLADYLVNKGLPFRDAHEAVGKLVAYSIENNLQLNEVPIEEYKKVSDLISNDVYDFLTVEGSIKNKKTQGSTSFQSVEEQISFAEKILADHER